MKFEVMGMEGNKVGFLGLGRKEADTQHLLVLGWRIL